MKNPLIRCISGLRVPGPQCGVSTASCRREGPPLRMDVGGPEFGALSWQPYLESTWIPRWRLRPMSPQPDQACQQMGGPWYLEPGQGGHTGSQTPSAAMSTWDMGAEVHTQTNHQQDACWAQAQGLKGKKTPTNSMDTKISHHAYYSAAEQSVEN